MSMGVLYNKQPCCSHSPRSAQCQLHMILESLPKSAPLVGQGSLFGQLLYTCCFSLCSLLPSPDCTDQIKRLMMKKYGRVVCNRQIAWNTERGWSWSYYYCNHILLPIVRKLAVVYWRLWSALVSRWCQRSLHWPIKCRGRQKRTDCPCALNVLWRFRLMLLWFDTTTDQRCCYSIPRAEIAFSDHASEMKTERWRICVAFACVCMHLFAFRWQLTV